MRRFTAKEGSAAVEFALLAPVMVASFFGVIESCELISANRRAEKGAAALADVIARFVEVKGTDICDTFTGVESLTTPQAAGDLRARVTSINVDSQKVARVEWSAVRGTGFTALAKNTVVTDQVPERLRMASENQPLVKSEVTLVYRSRFIFFVAPTITLTHEEYRRPRLVGALPRIDTTSPCGA